MKSSSKFYGLFFFSLIFISISYGQDDESRQQSNLPTFIGNRPGSNQVVGANAALQGTVTVQGISDESSPKSLTISIYANGTMVVRQPIKNRSSFNFNGVPRYGATLVVEADNLEIVSYPLGTLSPPPLLNRQDVILNWTQVGKVVERRNEIVSIRNSYSRSKENQKLFDKVIAELEKGKRENSQKLLKQLIEEDSNDYVAWTELGNIYFTEQKFSESENAYTKAIALKSDFLPAALNLGKLYLNQKKFEAAIEVLSNALNISKESADINHYLGEAYLQIKKGSKAVVYLNEAIRLAPIEKAEIHLRLAMLYNGAGAKDRAATEYKLFLEKIPDHPDKSKIKKYIEENSK